MDVKEYCDSLAFQLTVWQEEVANVTRIPEGFPEGDRALIAGQLAALQAIVEEMGRKIEEYRIECRLNVPAKRESRQRKSA